VSYVHPLAEGGQTRSAPRRTGAANRDCIPATPDDLVGVSLLAAPAGRAWIRFPISEASP